MKSSETMETYMQRGKLESKKLSTLYRGLQYEEFILSSFCERKVGDIS